MKLIYLNSVDSTQTYLHQYIINNNIDDELICVYTHDQTNGIGSRNNTWDGEKGNLFFSLAIHQENLPKDLPLSSSSIYFSYLLKDHLVQLGSKLWMKWPNDLYINDKKIGGTITQLKSNYLLIGTGINLKNTNNNYGYLDIEIDSKELLEKYLQTLQKDISWKKIFSKFSVEFDLSKKFKTTIENDKISMGEAYLNEDGSIQIDGKKVFSSR